MPRRKPKKVIAKQYEGLTKEEKRKKVVSEAWSRTEYFSCPLCLFSQVLEQKKKGRLRLDRVDLERAFIFQVRYAGGRGSGFYYNPAESLTLADVKKDPRFDDLVEQIKKQCNAILEALA